MAGELNTRDLDVLFLWLRERSFGNRAVAEIGDFVAHSDERQKGFAWNGAKWLFDQADFLGRRVPPHTALPVTVEQFRSAALGGFELYPPAEVKTKLGIGKKMARRALMSALDAVVEPQKTRLIVSRDLTAREAEVLDYFSTRLISQPVFTGGTLVSQLQTCIVKNGLSANLSGGLPPSMRDFVVLYAVEKMHLAKIRQSDERIVGLFASKAPAEPNGPEYLQISAGRTVSFQQREGNVIFPLYTTNLEAKDWCEPDLLEQFPWDMPLEISPSGKLQML